MAAIIAAVRDLIFTAKIEEAAKSHGASLVFADSQQALLGKVQAMRPGIIIVDLNMEGLGISRLPALIHAIAPQARIIGYLAHVQLDMKRQAESAGFIVCTRSELIRRLSDML